MESISQHLSQVKEGIDLLSVSEIEKVVAVLELVRKWGGTVYLFGNGGSAALASHCTNDLIKMTRVRAVCLSDCFPVVSAYGNDEGWENMYVKQLEVVFDQGKDCAFGISCSGNSENVVRALRWAGERDGLVVGLTGNRDGRIHEVVNRLVHAPVPDIRVQEDLHAIVCHALVRAMVENE
jgi:D-sedoheptulose 7-phosphate isomerase